MALFFKTVVSISINANLTTYIVYKFFRDVEAH